METQAENVQKLGKMIGDVKIAMLTTMEEDGTLRSRPMATQKTEFNGRDLWFFTQASSPKTSEVESHRDVNLSYANPDDNAYVSISGKGQVVRDPAKAKELWNPVLKAWFPKGLDDPELALLRVTVESAEYWDTPSSKMVQLIGLVKAMATGKSYEPSKDEHDKVSF